MTEKYSVALQNAQIAAKEATIGTSPILRLYDGTPPATADDALSGNTLLAEGTLPSDWAADPSDGSSVKNGTWTVTGQAGAAGGVTATFYRIYASDGVTCHVQGTLTITGDGGDMTVDNPNIAAGQVATVNTYTTTSGNA